MVDIVIQSLAASHPAKATVQRRVTFSDNLQICLPRRAKKNRVNSPRSAKRRNRNLEKNWHRSSAIWHRWMLLKRWMLISGGVFRWFEGMKWTCGALVELNMPSAILKLNCKETHGWDEVREGANGRWPGICWQDPRAWYWGGPSGAGDEMISIATENVE